MLELGRQGALSTGLILVVIVMAVAVIAFIVFMERAQRRLLIQYPKRQVGNKMFEGQSSHLPLKLNTSGVISADLRVLAIVVADHGRQFQRGQGTGMVPVDHHPARPWPSAVSDSLSGVDRVLRVLFIPRSCSIRPRPRDNLKKQGGFIPGIRPGERTAEYIDYVLSRITVLGAVYLAIVCLIPEILISYASVPF